MWGEAPLATLPNSPVGSHARPRALATTDLDRSGGAETEKALGLVGSTVRELGASVGGPCGAGLPEMHGLPWPSHTCLGADLSLIH